MNKLKNNLIPLAIAVGAVVLVLILRGAGLFAGFEYFLGDQLLEPVGASEEIVIISIDDDSIAKIGQWPWPREEYAKLLAVLAKNPPKVVGIDVLFAEASRVAKRDDEKLVQSLKQSAFPIVLASRVADGVTPLPQFVESQNVTVGEVSLVVDPDGVVRRANFENSFAMQINQAVPPPSGGATAGNTIATGRIVWAGPPGTFRRVPFYRVLEDKALAVKLKDKIVLVGSTATDLHDEQITAIDRGTAMPGVEIQANLANMLYKNVFVREAGGILVLLLILLVTLMLALAFIYLSGMWRPILTSLAVFGVMIIVLIIAWGENITLPIFYPSLVWFLSASGQVLYRYFGSERSQREIRSLFAKYVSGDVLEEILRNPSEVKLGGEEREVTVLFSDVRGFTTLSESMNPTELTAFINRYLTVMTEVILDNRGVVDKYIGDAIMAFWGAPVTTNTHALDAAKAATAMVERLEQFNQENKALSLREIDIGVGLNSGKVVVGNMGSHQRFDYTVMGDAVNLSSRLEGLTKAYRAQVIASESVLALAGVDELASAGIRTREIDQVKVKGKNNAVKIFELVPPSGRGKFEMIEKRFDLARDYYYRGDWDKCLKLLAEIETIEPHDGPSKVLRERCLQFKVMPPPSWDGVYEHKSK